MSERYYSDAMDLEFLSHVHAGKVRTKLPVHFSGDDDIMSLPNFMIVVQIHFATQQITNDLAKIGIFGQNLLESAAKWFYSWLERNYDSSISYEDFAAEFRNHFAQQLDPFKILHAFAKLKLSEVSIETYNTRFRELWALMPEGYWTVKVALLAYMSGRMKPICTLVALSHPEDLEVAYKGAYATVSIDHRSLPLLQGGHPEMMDRDWNVIMAGAPIQCSYLARGGAIAAKSRLLSGRWASG